MEKKQDKIKDKSTQELAYYTKQIILQREKINNCLKKVMNLSHDKQIEINNTLLKSIRSILKSKRKTKKTIISPKNKIYEKIFDEINSLGKPFYKHKKDLNNKIYQQSLELIAKHFRKHRINIIDIFKLGQEYFLNPDFSFKPEEGKISIPDFFEYRPEKIQFAPYLLKFTKSWFNEFSKGREHIEKHFMKKPKNKYVELTQDLTKIWEKETNSICSGFDIRQIIIFTDKMVKFAKLNNLNARTIFKCVEEYLGRNSNRITNSKFLNSDFFLSDALPKEMVKIGVVKSTRNIIFPKGE